MQEHDAVERTAGLMVGLAWRIIVIAVFIFCLMQGIRYCYSYGHTLLYEQAMEAEPGHDVEFTIEKGESTDQIAENLVELGLIRSKDSFKFQAKLFEATFYHGTYTLNTSMTIEKILGLLKEEGKKNMELEAKNLISETTAVAETTEDSSDVGTGNEG